MLKHFVLLAFVICLIASCRDAATKSGVSMSDDRLSDQLIGTWSVNNREYFEFGEFGRFKQHVYRDVNYGLWKIENGQLDMYYLEKNYVGNQKTRFSFGRNSLENESIKFLDSSSRVVIVNSVPWLRFDKNWDDSDIFRHPLIHDNFDPSEYD